MDYTIFLFLKQETDVLAIHLWITLPLLRQVSTGSGYASFAFLNNSDGESDFGISDFPRCYPHI